MTALSSLDGGQWNTAGCWMTMLGREMSNEQRKKSGEKQSNATGILLMKKSKYWGLLSIAQKPQPGPFDSIPHISNHRKSKEPVWGFWAITQKPQPGSLDSFDYANRKPKEI